MRSFIAKNVGLLQSLSFRQSLSRNPEILKNKDTGFRLKSCGDDNRFRLLQDAQIGEPVKWEIFIFGALLLFANISLRNGAPAVNLSFQKAAVYSGEWWRVITFPFVHVSLYHLLLDGIAFIMLYVGLEEEKRFRRATYMVFSIAGSLLFPILTKTQIENTGLCGLSGCAHGLMAISGLELIRRYSKGDALYRTGVLTLSVVVVKSIIEAVTGQVFFAWMHLGDIGTPLAGCHLGGVIGGVLAFLILAGRRAYKSPFVRGSIN